MVWAGEWRAARTVPRGPTHKSREQVQGINPAASGVGVKADIEAIELLVDEPDSIDFATFYSQEHEGQVRRAFLLLGTSSAAHDAVAEAFEEVFRRWDQIRDPGPYLNVVVINSCRDAAKRRGRETPTDRFPDCGHDDRADHMADCLMGLPFRQRAAVVLRYYGGESEASIAEYLDCRPGTVGSLIHRGLKALRLQLKELE